MAGSGPGAKLENPATEEVLAETSTTGIDMHQALAFARDTGGPALRELGFAQRGELLEGMTRAIHGAREELIELAIQNGGNTRSDAKFDIDGATATLQAYAELGKSLGDAKLLVDGEPTDIAGSRLQGWHVLSPRHGVAVHINAFNFPAWGWAEKAACAMLAGMPVVTKPATASGRHPEASHPARGPPTDSSTPIRSPRLHTGWTQSCSTPARRSGTAATRTRSTRVSATSRVRTTFRGRTTCRPRAQCSTQPAALASSPAASACLTASCQTPMLAKYSLASRCRLWSSSGMSRPT